MKTFMKKLVVITSLMIVSVSVLSEPPSITSTRFTVNGMVCAFCAQGIEKKLLKMTQTKDVYIDLAKKVVVVEPKEKMTLDTDLITTKIKDAGFDVSKVETVSGSVADIRKVIEDKQ